MNQITYIIGLIVVFLFILGFFGCAIATLHHGWRGKPYQANCA